MLPKRDGHNNACDLLFENSDRVYLLTVVLAGRARSLQSSPAFVTRGKNEDPISVAMRELESGSTTVAVLSDLLVEELQHFALSRHSD